MKNRPAAAALTDLATRLDEARIAANDIEATAPHDGVYGHISDALLKTLVRLRDGDRTRAEAVYQAILDGYIVTEALAVEAETHSALPAAVAVTADS